MGVLFGCELVHALTDTSSSWGVSLRLSMLALKILWGMSILLKFVATVLGLIHKHTLASLFVDVSCVALLACWLDRPLYSFALVLHEC